MNEVVKSVEIATRSPQDTALIIGILTGVSMFMLFIIKRWLDRLDKRMDSFSEKLNFTDGEIKLGKGLFLEYAERVKRIESKLESSIKSPSI